jgi:hypothetical protein
MMPIYLCFWASGEMILTTSTLRWSNCRPLENQVYIVPTSFMIHKLALKGCKWQKGVSIHARTLVQCPSTCNVHMECVATSPGMMKWGEAHSAEQDVKLRCLHKTDKKQFGPHRIAVRIVICWCFLLY